MSLLLSVDLETAEQVPEYLRSRGISYPVYVTNEAAMELIYPRGEATVPLTVLLDSSGRVRAVHSGWNARSEAALRRLASGDAAYSPTKASP